VKCSSTAVTRPSGSIEHLWPNRRQGTRVNGSRRQRHSLLQADVDFLISFLHLR